MLPKSTTSMCGMAWTFLKSNAMSVMIVSYLLLFMLLYANVSDYSDNSVNVEDNMDDWTAEMNYKQSSSLGSNNTDSHAGDQSDNVYDEVVRERIYKDNQMEAPILIPYPDRASDEDEFASDGVLICVSPKASR